MMVASVLAPNLTIEQLVERVILSRRLTRTDRCQLMLNLLTASLSQEELVLVDRILYGVRKGLLRIVE